MRRPSAWRSPGHVLASVKAIVQQETFERLLHAEPKAFCSSHSDHKAASGLLCRESDSARSYLSIFSERCFSVERLQPPSTQQVHKQRKGCRQEVVSAAYFVALTALQFNIVVTMMKISSCARVLRAALLPVDEKYKFDLTESPVICASGCVSLVINLPRSLCPCRYGLQTSSQEQKTS